jgi:hypothetical protein
LGSYKSSVTQLKFIQDFDCRQPTADGSPLSAVGGQNHRQTYAKLY